MGGPLFVLAMPKERAVNEENWAFFFEEGAQGPMNQCLHSVDHNKSFKDCMMNM